MNKENISEAGDHTTGGQPVCKPVMDTCQDDGWEFSIRYKTEIIPNITEEYEKIPEEGKTGHAKFIKQY